MKRFLFLILLCTLSTNISAQEADSLKLEPINIDSLAVKLDKLQHDYVLLYCNYELDRLTFLLKNVGVDANISTNSGLHYIYNGKFNMDLYIKLINSYDSEVGLLNSLKESYAIIKDVVLLKIISSNFSDTEIKLLKQQISTINDAIIFAESSLNTYKEIIDIYKEMK